MSKIENRVREFTIAQWKALQAGLSVEKEDILARPNLLAMLDALAGLKWVYHFLADLEPGRSSKPKVLARLQSLEKALSTYEKRLFHVEMMGKLELSPKGRKTEKDNQMVMRAVKKFSQKNASLSLKRVEKVLSENDFRLEKHIVAYENRIRMRLGRFLQEVEGPPSRIERYLSCHYFAAKCIYKVEPKEEKSVEWALKSLKAWQKMEQFGHRVFHDDIDNIAFDYFFRACEKTVNEWSDAFEALQGEFASKSNGNAPV